MTGLKLFTAFALIFLINQSEALNWPAFRVKYNATDELRLNSLYMIPKTIKEAYYSGYIKPPERQYDIRTTILCLKGDPRACALYDGKGTIAGYQVAFPASAANHKMHIDYHSKGFEKVTLFGQYLLASRIYFVPQGILNAGGRYFDGQIGTGLWIKIGNKLTEIPKKAYDLAVKKVPFKKGYCLDNMGVHYFYNPSKHLTVKDHQPWFLLYSTKGELHGFGFILYGRNYIDKYFWKRTPFNGNRDWHENIESSAIDIICQGCPKWMAEYIDKHGSISQHHFFIDKPWTITCE